MLFCSALPYIYDGKKIARKSWSEIDKCPWAYLSQEAFEPPGNEFYYNSSSALSLEDVLANDWYVKEDQKTMNFIGACKLIREKHLKMRRLGWDNQNCYITFNSFLNSNPIDIILCRKNCVTGAAYNAVLEDILTEDWVEFKEEV